uniref:Elongation of very long chain fatty acids protein n=1 Tax=Cyprinus carpio carpio TaxID=630221 RepID=A0A9J7YFE1_CYPCA
MSCFSQKCDSRVIVSCIDCCNGPPCRTSEFTPTYCVLTRSSGGSDIREISVRRYLSERDRYGVFPHCCCLSVSIMGAMRTGWYMFSLVRSRGLRESVCDTGFFSASVSKFWAFAFTLSKAPELGDTVFIVLRKQRLIFLHWYHHITVLLYTWYTYKDRVAGGGWFMTMNYTVHAFMYSYYTAKAAGVRVPRPFAMLITLMQITQMVMGVSIVGLLYLWNNEKHCFSTMQNIICASLMYLSYLLLFSVFFYQSYLKRSGDEKRVKRE